MGPLFSYWTGPVSWMERASINSAAAMGCPVTLFTYEPEALKRAQLPAKIEDAAKIIGPGILPARVETRANSFSNIFRLAAMRAGCGTWFDLDVIFLKPLQDSPYLFGLENKKIICNAILRMPPESALLDSYFNFCLQKPGCIAPPWWSVRHRANTRFKQIQRLLTGRTPPRIQTGPIALTHFVTTHSMYHLAQPQSVFYPVHHSECRALVEQDDGLEGRIQPQTLTVHLWRAAYKKELGFAFPPSSSWLGRKCRELGITHGAVQSA